MTLDLKQHATLILFLLQFVVFAPFAFYLSSFLDDYRTFKQATDNKLDQCVTWERLDERLTPIWTIIAEGRG